MTDPVRVAIVAEGSSDAAVLVALVEAVAWAGGHEWLRDHLDTFGSLDGLATFAGEPGERCITWVAVKRLAREHRIRLRRRGDGAFTAEVRKALAVGAIFARGPSPGVVMVHRDEDVIADAGDRAVAVALCDENGAVLALPSPCTEAWVLRCAGSPVPSTSERAKDAAGQAGLRDPGAIRTLLCRTPLTALEAAPDARGFLQQIRDLLLPRILRG